MNVLERLDPGLPPLMLAASSAAIVAVIALGAEALARLAVEARGRDAARGLSRRIC